MLKSLSGTRIRECRRKTQLTQKALAEAAGISPSYLNLIEHNKRSVAGKVLLAIARVLDVAPAELADGVESGLISDLRQAAAHLPQQNAETAVIEEMASRFPGWARLLTALYRQTRDQEGAIAALSDRLTHDPFLAESLHSMLSNITAIRSTANILKNIEDIEPERQARFHAIIHEESRRLSDVAQALTAYFDHATDPQAGDATPEEAIDGFLAKHDYHFARIDALRDAAPGDVAKVVDDLINDEQHLKTPESRQMVQRIVSDYAIDAQVMPLLQFDNAARDCGYNPARLAQEFSTDLHSVFRRLTHLAREGADAPPFGLIVSNAAGRALQRRPLPEFSLPRHGNACPLWPLYQSFSQPERPITSLLELPGKKRFISLAVALPNGLPAFGAIPEYRGAMLIIGDDRLDLLSGWLPPLGAADLIGTACRICPRTACSARSEPQILGQNTITP